MKISVITVVYNACDTIRDTILSVSKQTHSDIEHIVIDGNSTDGTLDIINEYRFSNLEVYSEPDNGIYDAMNKGLQRSQGEVVGFLNADDIFSDCESLSRVEKAFVDPNVEACFADLVYVSKDNRRVVRRWKSRKFEFGAFAKGWSPAHPTFYIRRSALDRLGLFNPHFKLAADTEFMMRYLEKGNVCSQYIPFVQVRMRVGGATNDSWRNILLQNQEIFRALRLNKLQFSRFVFIFNKFINRLIQRLCY